ncbi:Hydrogen cyanide synthase subunit HcnB [compost metagenome]
MAPGPDLTGGPCKIRVSGDARRIGGADAAIAHGRYVAACVAADLHKNSISGGIVAGRDDVVRTLAGRPFIDKAFPRGLATQVLEDNTIVCRCEELTAGDLRTAIGNGITEMNHLRGILRCGMGPCQGRSCAVTVARLLAESPGANTPAPFRARPPLRPLPLIALANLSGLDPELSQIVSLGDKPEAEAMEQPHE